MSLLTLFTLFLSIFFFSRLLQIISKLARDPLFKSFQPKQHANIHTHTHIFTSNFHDALHTIDWRVTSNQIRLEWEWGAGGRLCNILLVMHACMITSQLFLFHVSSPCALCFVCVCVCIKWFSFWLLNQNFVNGAFFSAFALNRFPFFVYFLLLLFFHFFVLLSSCHWIPCQSFSLSVCAFVPIHV